MTQVGWFVIGTGKFGEYVIGRQFVGMEENVTYWTDRGYELTSCFVPEE